MSKITPIPKSIFSIINLETEDYKIAPGMQTVSSKRDSIKLESSKQETNLIFATNQQSVEKKDSGLQSPTLFTLIDVNSQRNELKFQEAAEKGNENYIRPAAKKLSSILNDFHTPKPEISEEFRFKFPVFLEVMVYQIIFFFFLGPFIHILLLFPFTNRHVLRNLQFIGIPCLVQSIQWALLMVILVLYIFDNMTNKQIKDVYAIELYDPFLITFIRIVFISSKYALSTSRFMRLFHSQTLSTQKMINEFVIVSSILQQDSSDVDEQVQQSIIRLKVDTSAFYFRFLGHDLDGVSKEEFTKANILQNLVHKTMLTRSQISKSLTRVHPLPMDSEFESMPIDSTTTLESQFKTKRSTEAETIFKDFIALMSKHHSLEKEMLSGYLFSTEIVKKARASLGKSVVIWGLVLGTIRALLPLFARLYEEKSCIPTSKIEICIAISTMISTFWFFSLNYVVASISLVDLKLKLLILRQATTLLPSYQGIDSNRCTPPLNIYDLVSLRAWETFREIFVDYGNIYQSKESCNLTLSLTNLTVSLTVYLVQLFVIILYFLKLINFEIGIGNAVVLIYEVAIAIGIFVLLMARGAQINDLFAVHRSRLLYVKRIFSNMIVMKQFYLERKEMETDNPLIQQGILYFRKIFPDDDQFARNCVVRLSELQKIVGGMIENLDATSVDNPVKVFGFAISWQTLKALGALLASLGVAIYHSQSSL